MFARSKPDTDNRIASLQEEVNRLTEKITKVDIEAQLRAAVEVGPDPVRHHAVQALKFIKNFRDAKARWEAQETTT